MLVKREKFCVREASNAADKVSLRIDFANGSDFPSDLSRYSLIIHCGACMYNRAYMLSRQQAAIDAGVPFCNYGLTIAFLQGILDDISIPY